MPTAAVVVLMAFLVPPSTLRPAEPLSCGSRTVIETVQRMASGMNWPLGGPTVKVFRFYNYRGNPNLGEAPTSLTDTRNPCKVNILTDRGEFGFTYGWKLVDGDIFVMGQLGDPDEEIRSR